MRVRVAWFGRPGGSPYEGQVADYLKRVSRRWQADDVPLKTATGGRDSDPGRALKREAEALRRTRPDGWQLVVLDVAGQTMTSSAFAEAMARAEDGGCRGVLFAIGSDLGLDPAIHGEAAWRLSLSRLTLPHLLARLTLWEQLFRASDILGGGQYHRA